MKILIAIPSKNRVEILKQNALTWLKTCGYDWQVFVEPQDLMQYQIIVSDSNLVVIGGNDKGLGFCKRAIKQYANLHGYTHIFKIDDDVKGFTKFRQRLSDEEHAVWFKDFTIEIMEGLQLHPRIKAVAFPYHFEMYEKKKWEISKRVQTAYIVQTDAMHISDDISVFEDFATGLKIIADGNLVVKYGMAGILMGVKVGGGTGGHQSFDRFEQAKKEVIELRKIYPPLNFRKVDKPWKIEPDLSSVEIPKRL